VSPADNTWVNAIEIPGLPLLNAVSSTISSVSCASASNCGAGGSYTDPTGATQPLAITKQ
jgi:hypothetical protein